MRAVDTFVGFDSAWTDNAKAPGAITAVSVEGGRAVAWHAPRLVSFDGARAFIDGVRSAAGVTIVALDQPTIVPNASGMRQVERVAASVVSWLGGGVQPSNTGRIGMFCPASPIWPFLSALDAVEDPEVSRTAAAGLFIMEVFPALALASMNPAFFGRLAAPRYNPARRRTFRQAAWINVAGTAAEQADAFGCDEMADWCRNSARIARPSKADQDRLDSCLCALVALGWRRRPRDQSILLGDLRSGYMVLPASPDLRARLSDAARRIRVPVDGIVP